MDTVAVWSHTASSECLGHGAARLPRSDLREGPISKRGVLF